MVWNIVVDLNNARLVKIRLDLAFLTIGRYA